jgi:PIN domain nuclease of toxin-antitoxin system
LGKLELPGNPVAFIFEQLSANDIIELPVRMNHTLHVYSLPPHHRDPFDRLLVSQAQLEILPIISADKQIAEYDVKVIW